MATETVSDAADLAAKEAAAREAAAKEARVHEQLAELQVQADRLAAARIKLQKQLPPVPIDPHKPETWPWGRMVMAIKEGYYPNRIPDPGHRVSLPRLRKPGEVFEVAHEGHFSPFTNESPMGWMAEPGTALPDAADPSIPLTTVNNRVLDKMQIAKQVKTEFGGVHKS